MFTDEGNAGLGQLHAAERENSKIEKWSRVDCAHIQATELYNTTLEATHIKAK